MARLFPEDSPISVAADPYGVPVQVLLLDHWRVVAQICNRRRTVAAWWEPAAAAHREFFKIATTDGPVSPAPYYGAKFDGPGCEWPMLDIPVFKIGCLAGEYQALMKTASQSVWTTPTNMAIHPDFDRVADVRFVGPSDGMAGLITDVTNNGEFYLFAVSKSGQYTLRAVSSSGWLALILWTPDDPVQLGCQ